MTSNETWIVLVATVTLSFYFFVLIVFLHNVFKYLYQGDRFSISNVQLTTFYVNVIIVLLLRMA